MSKGPLDHPRLLAIEQSIDTGQLDQAQRLLAELGDVAFFRYATTYLATRLLFERGRLDVAAVAERLRDVLRVSGFFPEAEAMLEAAEDGSLERASANFKLRTADSLGVGPSSAQAAAAAEPELDYEVSSDPEELFVGLRKPSDPSLPSIPRAPEMPRFTPTEEPQPFDYPSSPGTTTAPWGSTLESSPSPAPAALGRPPSSRPSAKLRASRASDHESTPVIRSGLPPPSEQTAPPNLFEIAGMLDQRRFVDALRAIDRFGPELSPDQVLLRARALCGGGRAAEARATLERLGCAPLLDPDVRAAAARLLLEIGAPEVALEQARKAHDDDSEPPLVRLTLAWASLRVGRRTGDLLLLGEADTILHSLKARADPMPSQVQALRASIYAEIGDPERAISAAERALSLDPRSTDALAALALAAARLGRAADAERAWRKLFEVHVDEAEVLRLRLAELGVNLSARRDSSPASSGRAGAWDALEVLLLRDRRAEAIDGFEQACRLRRSELKTRGTENIGLIAGAAANLLTTIGVFSQFAPYDFSLFSIARITAALDTLYGARPRPKAEDDEDTLLLIGAYLGEALRQAYEGRWTGRTSSLEELAVTSDDGDWLPFRALRVRLQYGAELELGSVSTALTHPGADPLKRRIAPAVAPPTFWGPDEWPTPSLLPDVGQALSRSVVSLYTREFASGPLDLSLESLNAIDAWLGLVAPACAPAPSPNEPWLKRAAVFAGGYVGEVMRRTLGARWALDAQTASDETAYVLVLSDETKTLPVSQAFQRLLGAKKTTMNEYAAALVSR